MHWPHWGPTLQCLVAVCHCAPGGAASGSSPTASSVDAPDPHRPFALPPLTLNPNPVPAGKARLDADSSDEEDDEDFDLGGAEAAQQAADADASDSDSDSEVEEEVRRCRPRKTNFVEYNALSASSGHTLGS